MRLNSIIFLIGFVLIAAAWAKDDDDKEEPQKLGVLHDDALLNIGDGLFDDTPPKKEAPAPSKGKRKRGKGKKPPPKEEEPLIIGDGIVEDSKPEPKPYKEPEIVGDGIVGDAIKNRPKGKKKGKGKKPPPKEEEPLIIGDGIVEDSKPEPKPYKEPEIVGDGIVGDAIKNKPKGKKKGKKSPAKEEAPAKKEDPANEDTPIIIGDGIFDDDPKDTPKDPETPPKEEQKDPETPPKGKKKKKPKKGGYEEPLIVGPDAPEEAKPPKEKKPCEDKHEGCSSNASVCKNDTYIIMMVLNCAKTCKRCGEFFHLPDSTAPIKDTSLKCLKKEMRDRCQDEEIKEKCPYTCSKKPKKSKA